ncbi:MAG: hypothetical protein KF874_11910 [Rhizobiaceae bacterium]|nr:hypothetical protein [Rhizobiaceae bacterium]
MTGEMQFRSGNPYRYTYAMEAFNRQQAHNLQVLQSFSSSPNFPSQFPEIAPDSLPDTAPQYFEPQQMFASGIVGESRQPRLPDTYLDGLYSEEDHVLSDSGYYETDFSALQQTPMQSVTPASNQPLVSQPQAYLLKRENADAIDTRTGQIVPGTQVQRIRQGWDAHSISSSSNNQFVTRDPRLDYSGSDDFPF